jgi:uncharacterized membrane protein
MRELHILAGTLALLAGALALVARKGSPLHRLAGRGFALAMLVMAGSSLVISVGLRPNPGNVVAALLVTYLVATSWLTLTHRASAARAPLLGLMLVALATAGAGIAIGIDASRRFNGVIDGIPGGVLIVFGAIALLGASLDLRVLIAGRIEGSARTTRHLWRMSFAMWMATMSFFLGQARFIPEPLRRVELLLLPGLLVAIIGGHALAKKGTGKKGDGGN